MAVARVITLPELRQDLVAGALLREESSWLLDTPLLIGRDTCRDEQRGTTLEEQGRACPVSRDAWRACIAVLLTQIQMIWAKQSISVHWGAKQLTK